MATERRRAPRARHVRAMVLLLLTATLTLAATTQSASAAVAHPSGMVESSHQDSTGLMSVSGFAYDAWHRSSPILLDVVVDDRIVARFYTNRLRPDINRNFHVTGNHGFLWTARLHLAKFVKVYAHGVVAGETLTRIGLTYLNGYNSAGARIVAQAKAHLGQAYVYGAAGPSAFDCSGLTSYVYRAAGVKVLAHSAEAQRESVRLIPRSAALPGDLVFYVSGGYAYHVAIYNGSNAIGAVDEAVGVAYQSLSGTLQYGTTWH